jgi:isopentenyl diphosphate isomerase/L-lactate dehydrogenase-like FMN-dependent dehydrogenase
LNLPELIDCHVSLAQLQWYREQWPGKLIVKGILDADEAAACVEVGADAIVVSNHGGRQLDAAETAIDAPPWGNWDALKLSACLNFYPTNKPVKQ